jgi:hypothetical protein
MEEQIREDRALLASSQLDLALAAEGFYGSKQTKVEQAASHWPEVWRLAGYRGSTVPLPAAGTIGTAITEEVSHVDQADEAREHQGDRGVRLELGLSRLGSEAAI